jgi:hypothetical protein
VRISSCIACCLWLTFVVATGATHATDLCGAVSGTLTAGGRATGETLRFRALPSSDLFIPWGANFKRQSGQNDWSTPETAKRGRLSLSAVRYIGSRSDDCLARIRKPALRPTERAVTAEPARTPRIPVRLSKWTVRPNETHASGSRRRSIDHGQLIVRSDEVESTPQLPAYGSIARTR